MNNVVLGTADLSIEDDENASGFWRLKAPRWLWVIVR